ncbi:hypothetical protein [Thermovibrio sp.]
MKEKLLNFLIFFFSLVIVVSLAVIFLYREPQSFSHAPSKVSSSSLKESSPSSSSSVESSSLSKPEKEKGSENFPPEVLDKVNSLYQVLTSYLTYLKGGIGEKPSLIFKVGVDSGINRLYFLTFYPMEWPFVKVSLNGYNFSPSKVYLCDNGLLLVEVDLHGLFPPEVPKGSLGDYGVLLTFTSSGPEVEPFKPDNCNYNGFVFNLSGELAGVCFGGNFIDAQSLYSQVPSSCKIIYNKEEVNGNL